MSGRQPPEAPTATETLWNRAFVLLVVLTFLCTSNMAVFFGLHGYLLDLGVDERLSGFIIGVFALVGLAGRPFLSLRIHPANARRWIFWGCLGSLLSLLAYNPAQSVAALLVVRCLHGMAYVAMVTGLTAASVAAIPQSRSGQAYSVFGIVMVLPFAVVPPLAVWAERVLGGFLPVLNLSALVLALNLPLLAFLPGIPQGGEQHGRAAGFKGLLVSLSNRGITMILIMSLLSFTAFAPVFFYMDSFARGLGFANVGWFFMVNTFAELAVRLLAGKRLDRYSKPKMLAGSLALLSLSYLVLAGARGPIWLWVVAVGLGLGWGMAMPLFNALVFDNSPPALRALNANLAMLTFQAGLFLGPLLGGWMVAAGGYAWLFSICAGLCLTSLLMVPIASAFQTTNSAIRPEGH